ncbi:DNA glycosylase AlkZ-like family protein [Conexibacter sp. SYSU D00693]|uniref:DNA glycosylase AlkZ-like family protein n=1 Tax=Conexibacter sp. SYSU D00693 TaxID=2812560 RepID=UPI00196A2BCE|nr:crosslink repair DNA glycosylase YcaQ family protein [Conexibacter sp. SYSU D00693]
MLRVDAEQALAFRAARTGLAERVDDLAAAAACPMSDFARDGALLALAARAKDVTRERYLEAVDAGELVLAHVVRGAIHALRPVDHPRFGRAVLASDDAELGAQLGQQVQRLVAEHGLRATDALAEVTSATADALRRAGALTKDELHAALRSRVREELMPWCRSCASHHVAPMLWRWATVAAGARLDRDRRYVLRAAPPPAPPAADALRGFLRAYGPARPADAAAWTGMARPQAKRVWAGVQDQLAEVELVGARAWALREDLEDLASPPPIGGCRLLPPGDPHLQAPNRPLLAPDDALRKRLFRPVASPGAVLHDGRLAGTWRARAKGRTRTEVTVEALTPVPRAELEAEALRIAELRGAPDLVLVVA